MNRRTQSIGGMEDRLEMQLLVVASKVVKNFLSI